MVREGQFAGVRAGSKGSTGSAASAGRRAGPSSRATGGNSTRLAGIEDLANQLPRRVSGLARMLYGASGSTLPRGMRSVLFALSAGPLRISQVARQEGVGQSAATRMVARLEALGLVRRERSREDGRVVMVSVTDRGRAELEDMREQSRRVMRAVLRDLSVRELRQLTQASDALELLIGLISAPGRVDGAAKEAHSTSAASARGNSRRALPS